VKTAIGEKMYNDDYDTIHFPEDTYVNSVDSSYQPPEINISWFLEGAPEVIDYSIPDTAQEDKSYLKRVATLSREILEEELGIRCKLEETKIHGSEVGDDRVDISLNPRNLALELVVQEQVFRMETSKEDTFLTDRLWNFCEVTCPIPSAEFESFDYARRRGSFKHLGFYDPPILRLILDVSKGDNSHSSTAVGKAQLLASRMNTRDDIQLEADISCFFQDACLRTTNSHDPKYLPRVMGGSGCRAPFGNPANLYTYVLCYKNGTYSRVYGSATNELRIVLQNLDRGEQDTPILCARLRMKQEYLHGTYGASVMVNRLPDLTRSDGTIVLPAYRNLGPANTIQQAESRLVRAKMLMTRTEASMLLEKSKRIEEGLIGIEDPLEVELGSKRISKRKREEYEGALRANSAFQRLLSRSANGTEVDKLVKEGFLNLTCGVKDFTKRDAFDLYRGLYSESYTIDNLIKTEDMYFSDEIADPGTFSVPGLLLKPIFSSGERLVQTTTKVGLYQISQSMLAWCEDLTKRLKSARRPNSVLDAETLIRVFNEDREWVNDDDGLVGLISLDAAERGSTQLESIILVTDDRKLSGRVARSANILVYRVPAKDAILVSQQEVLNSKSNFSLSTIWGSINHELHPKTPKPYRLYVDTGSVSAAASKMLVSPEGPPGLIKYKSFEPIFSGYVTHGNTQRRVSKISKFQEEEISYARFEISYPLRTATGKISLPGHRK
jgi:hypothetical protein